MRLLSILGVLIILCSVSAAHAAMGSTVRTLVTIPGPGVAPYINYAYCDQDSNDRGVDCENYKVRDAYLESGVSSNDYSNRLSIPGLGRTGIPILSYGVCAEDFRAQFWGTTANPSVFEWTMSPNEYCWRGRGAGNTQIANMPGMFNTVAGSAPFFSGSSMGAGQHPPGPADAPAAFAPIFAWFGNAYWKGSATGATNHMYTLPLQYSCTEYYVQVNQASHGDWSMGNKLVDPGGAYGWSASLNDFTLQLAENPQRQLTTIDLRMHDHSPGEGGVVFTLWCVEPYKCGDGAITNGEQCDGLTRPGWATCPSQGYASGTPSCSPTCQLDWSSCSSCGNGICEGAETAISCPSDCVPMAAACPGGTVWNAGTSLCEPAGICGGPFWTGGCMLQNGPTAGGCVCCGGLEGSSGTCQVPSCGFAGMIDGAGWGVDSTPGRACGSEVKTPPLATHYCANTNAADVELTPGNPVDGRCCKKGEYFNPTDGKCISSEECDSVLPNYCHRDARGFSFANFLLYMRDPTCIGVSGGLQKPSGLSACGGTVAGTPKNGDIDYYDWTDAIGALIGAQIY